MYIKIKNIKISLTCMASFNAAALLALGPPPGMTGIFGNDEEGV